MKLLILLLAFLLIAPVSFSTDFNTIYKMGALVTDGGQTNMAYFVGGESSIKTTKTGFKASTRFGYYSWQDESPEKQGFFSTVAIKQIVAPNFMDWYLCAKSGFLNEVVNGDDIQRMIVGFETGITPSGVIDISIGADLIPADGRGDKVFLYGALNFNL